MNGFGSEEFVTYKTRVSGGNLLPLDYEGTFQLSTAKQEREKMIIV